MNNQENLDMERFVGRSIKWIVACFLCFASIMMTMLILMLRQENKEIQETEPIKTVQPVIEQPIVIVISTNTVVEPDKVADVVDDVSVQIDGVEYLEQCVEAEAGNKDFLGKAYVCDVILNRLDMDKYNSVYEVIDDTGQFQCVRNGSINKVKVSDDTKYIVEREIERRLNSDILFFKTGWYHSGKEPCFKHGAHYFSK